MRVLLLALTLIAGGVVLAQGLPPGGGTSTSIAGTSINVHDITLGADAGVTAITMKTGARINLGTDGGFIYTDSANTTSPHNITTLGTISSRATSGQYAFGLVGGARINFGLQADGSAFSNNYLYTDGNGTLTYNGGYGVAAYSFNAPASATAVIVGKLADGASAVGTAIDTSVTYANAGAKLISIRNLATEKAYFNKDGWLYMGTSGAFVGNLGSATYMSSLNTGGIVASSLAGNGTATELAINGSKTDDATAKSVIINAGSALSTAGAKILSIQNAGTEKAHFGKDGVLTFLVAGNNVVMPFGSGVDLGSSQVIRSGFGGAELNTNLVFTSGGNVGSAVYPVGVLYTSGVISQAGTDSSGTPGNVTINKPSGRAAIAAAATAVTVTSNKCTATSIVHITPMEIDGTLTHFKVVPAAGSFTVTGNAAATANWPFMFTIKDIF